ncbi:hypothetical protein CDAR_7051 [Caerostris darwini]|uniref:Uncharacterized protein n=1 Tax=Caerostris darwini TaxID=1538125 RepID=A0AAV4PIX1_9ARAC|nr:hypothetical protein CDAR_7051 [Caerostris darwini]
MSCDASEGNGMIDCFACSREKPLLSTAKRAVGGIASGHSVYQSSNPTEKEAQQQTLKWKRLVCVLRWHSIWRQVLSTISAFERAECSKFKWRRGGDSKTSCSSGLVQRFMSTDASEGNEMIGCFTYSREKPSLSTVERAVGGIANRSLSLSALWERWLVGILPLIFVLGGLTSFKKEALGEVILFTENTKQWHPCSTLPVPLCGFATASVPSIIENKLTASPHRELLVINKDVFSRAGTLYYPK